jgi:hypothetical protein
MSDVPNTDAIESLARAIGTNYILDPKLFRDADGKNVPEPTVTFVRTNLSVRQVLSRVLKEHGLFLVKDPVTSIAQIRNRNQLANPVDASLLDGGTNFVVPVIQFQDVPPADALASLIKLAAINAIVDLKKTEARISPGNPPGEPILSVRWEDVSARQAIIALCESYDLAIVKDDAAGVIRIKRKN